MKTLTLSVFLCAIGTFPAQNSLDFDIDLSQGQSIEQPVEANTAINIYLTNKLFRNAIYSINIVKEGKAVEPIPFAPSGSNAAPGHEIAGAASKDSDCIAFAKAVDDTRNITDEELIPGALTFLSDEMARLQGAGKTCTAEFARAQKLIDAPRQLLWTGKLRPGEQVEVTITRQTASGPKTWKLLLKAPHKGSWETSYGFTFITQLFSSEDRYYSRPLDGNYVITREANRRVFDYAPTVDFTYYPSRYAGNPFFVSFSGGVGYDFQSPVAHLSFTFVFYQNIQFHMGMIFHSQQALMGQYSAGDEITEQLTQEQLHENRYTLNPFFSLSYRFKQNPRGGG